MQQILQLPGTIVFAAADRLSPLLERRIVDRLAWAFGLLMIAAICAYGVLKPAYNWDMAAYVATALENRIDDAGVLHETTWDIMRAGAPEAQMHVLSDGNVYNAHQYRNPESFQSQLSMYRVKVAYIGFIRAMEPLFGIAGGALAASIALSALFGLIVMMWLSREQAIQSVVMLFPLLVIADYLHMTIAVVPDMMLAAVAMAALYFLARGRDWLAAAILVFSVLVRPDNVIMTFALLIAMAVFRLKVLPMAVAFAASLAAIIFISQGGDHPGWWAHFWFSCIELQNSMIGFDPEFSVQALIKGYARGVSVALRHSEWPMILMMLLAAWGLLARAGKAKDRRANALLFAMAIGTCGKFASFPLPDDRFFFVFIAGMAVVLAAMWKPDFSMPARAART
jgi:hypothetical protein